MTNRHDIVACARQFIGARFIHQGRSSEGMDCLGLLLLTATKAGLTFEGHPPLLLDVPNYGLRPNTAVLQEKLNQFLTPIAKEAL